MIVNLSTLKVVGTLLAPLLLPRLVSFVLAPKPYLGPRKALPKAVRFLLVLLALWILAVLLSTFAFPSENVILRTVSRPQTSGDVLRTRLAAVRGGPANLLPLDHSLLERLSTQDGRLLYILYGPEVMTQCAWCEVESPHTYLYYALATRPMIHLLHVTVLAVATSPILSREASAWRSHAIIAAIVVGLGEGGILATVNFRDNLAAKGPSEIFWWHWNLVLGRGVAFVTVDMILGILLFLSGTNRIPTGQVDAHRRIEEVAKQMETAWLRLRSANVLKSTIIRDPRLARQAVNFFARDELVTQQAMEDETVNEVRRRVAARLGDSVSPNDAAFCESLLDVAV